MPPTENPAVLESFFEFLGGSKGYLFAGPNFNNLAHGWVRTNATCPFLRTCKIPRRPILTRSPFLDGAPWQFI